LQDYIRAIGPITVEQVQNLALYHPQFGYYANSRVIGRHGDFLTSPEISQLFGEMLAFWCIAQWQEAGSPPAIHLIELGPGRGTLLQDILRIGARQANFLESLTVSCVEICPYLGELQHQNLHHYPFVYWYKDLMEVPKGADFTLVIANEFFDTLPIRQFIGSEERKVCYSEVEKELVFVPPGNPNSLKEICPMATDVMHQILNHLS